MADKRVKNSLDALVVALCLDYERRQKVIEGGMASRRTDTEFRYYNFKIHDAVVEIVGEKIADTYIYEIGNSIGYAKSALNCASETFYKQYKRLIIGNIAKKLHLCD